MNMKTLAILNNEQGQKFMDEEGNLRKAEIAFKKAIQAASDWSVPWYNLGLLYKREKNWPESLRCNQMAAQLNQEDQAAWWNLGIAATALGNWAEARRAWTAFGINMPAGDSEIVMNLGLIPIRINPDGNGEVVWCSRIDPARAIIKSVPLPNSGHRFGDLLLHDGAPNGYRELDGQDIPVFDALQLLTPSGYATFEVKVEADSAHALDALFELAAKHQMGIEDWNTIRRLCHECSTGRPGPYTTSQPFILREQMLFGIAALNEQLLRAMLADWTSSWSLCRVVSATCALK